MSKPKKLVKRIKYTVYRVRYAAGDTDCLTLERANEEVLRLSWVGIAASVTRFKRTKK